MVNLRYGDRVTGLQMKVFGASRVNIGCLYRYGERQREAETVRETDFYVAKTKDIKYNIIYRLFSWKEVKISVVLKFFFFNFLLSFL